MNYPGFPGNPISNSTYTIAQGGFYYLFTVVVTRINLTFDSSGNPTLSPLTFQVQLPQVGPVGGVLIYLSPGFPRSVTVGTTYLVTPGSGTYILTQINPQTNNMGETHNLSIPAANNLIGSSTAFSAFADNPITLPYTISQGGFNYQVTVSDAFLSALLTPTNLPAITSAFTITPIGNGSLTFVASVSPPVVYSLAELGFTYLVTPGQFGYNVRPVVPTALSSPVTTLTNSGTYTVDSYTNFNLPNISAARLYIINVTSQGVGSTITATGEQVISGNGFLGIVYTFPQTGFYRFDNFLAPGNWVLTYFRSNHKIGAIVGATPSNGFPPYPGNPISNGFNITQGGYNYVAGSPSFLKVTGFNLSPFTLLSPGGPGINLVVNGVSIGLYSPTLTTYLITPASQQTNPSGYIISVIIPASYPQYPSAIDASTNPTISVNNTVYDIINSGTIILQNLPIVANIIGTSNSVIFTFGGPPSVPLELGPGVYYLYTFSGITIESFPATYSASNSTTAIPPRIRYNNTTAQNGTQLDTLIDSDIPGANAHFNNIGVMERKDLPAFVIPQSAPNANYNIQQIGTESDHYRGGNQIERTTSVLVPLGTSYTASEKDRIILLAGNNSVTLPTVLALNAQPTASGSEVPNGTIYKIINLNSSDTSTVNASGVPIDCGSNSSGSITVNPAETVTLTAIALSSSGSSTPTFYTLQRSPC